MGRVKEAMMEASDKAETRTAEQVVKETHAAQQAADLAEKKAAKTQIWRALSPTDPAFTKPFDRRGFKGTMIDPTWRMQRMTEVFGPVGQGWGWEEMCHVIESGCVFIQMRAWYRTGADVAPLFTGPQWGGTELMMKRGKGENATLVPNDEAFKMSATDALGKCLLSLGLSADIYLGLFDDVKYREEVGEVYDAKRRQQELAKRDEKRDAGRAHVAGGGDNGRAAEGATEDRATAEGAPATEERTGHEEVNDGERQMSDADWVKLQVKLFNATKKLAAVKAAWSTIHSEVTALAEESPDLAQEIVAAYQRAVTRVTPKAVTQAAE